MRRNRCRKSRKPRPGTRRRSDEATPVPPLFRLGTRRQGAMNGRSVRVRSESRLLTVFAHQSCLRRPDPATSPIPDGESGGWRSSCAARHPSLLANSSRRPIQGPKRLNAQPRKGDDWRLQVGGTSRCPERPCYPRCSIGRTQMRRRLQGQVLQALVLHHRQQLVRTTRSRCRRRRANWPWVLRSNG